MSRTDAHTRYEFLPDGREYAEAREQCVRTDPYAWFTGHRPEWNREWNKHWSRRSLHHWYAVQENRKSRRQARQAIQREDYDALPTHGTGRHTAAWLAW